ncbi:MAG: hypothetical protein Q8862_12085 [Bacteroidota bacterium]|nr:hypothetical protein [Bacteroidota bacterium]
MNTGLRIIHLIRDRFQYLENAVCVYAEPDSSLSVSFFNRATYSKLVTLKIDNVTQGLRKLREAQPLQSVSWKKPSVFPMEIRRLVDVEPGFFEDESDTLLLIKINNQFDKLSDLLIIDLKASMLDKILKTELKEIKPRELLSEHISGVVIAYMNTIVDDLGQREQLHQMCQSLILENQQLKEQIRKQENRLKQLRLDHADHMLQNYRDRYGMKLELSNAAREKLNLFEGKEKDIDRALDRAVNWIRESTVTLSGEEIIPILEQHLQFYNEVIDIPKLPVEEKEKKKYQRTIELLDRYENAALLLRQQGHTLTGKNVGKFCPQSISAPAITDSLRKHELKIIDLCKIYPSRWNLIRKEFKPVVNLLRRYRLL